MDPSIRHGQSSFVYWLTQSKFLTLPSPITMSKAKIFPAYCNVSWKSSQKHLGILMQVLENVLWLGIPAPGEKGATSSWLLSTTSPEQPWLYYICDPIYNFFGKMEFAVKVWKISFSLALLFEIYQDPEADKKGRNLFIATAITRLVKICFLSMSTLLDQIFESYQTLWIRKVENGQQSGLIVLSGDFDAHQSSKCTGRSCPKTWVPTKLYLIMGTSLGKIMPNFHLQKDNICLTEL